jgi:hypothetical protein
MWQKSLSNCGIEPALAGFLQDLVADERGVEIGVAQALDRRVRAVADLGEEEIRAEERPQVGERETGLAMKPCGSGNLTLPAAWTCGILTLTTTGLI